MSYESAGEPGGLGEQKCVVWLPALVEKDGSPFPLGCDCSRELLMPQPSSPAGAVPAGSYSLWAQPYPRAVTYLHQLMLLSTCYEVWYDKIDFFFLNLKTWFDYISLFLMFLGIISNGAITFGCVQYKNSKSWKCIWLNVWLKFHLSQAGQVCQGHFQYGPNFMPLITL